MVRIAAVLLMALALVSCKEDTEVWDTTCRLYDAYEEAEGRPAGACDYIAAPDIVYEPMQEGRYGYYPGGYIIYINDSIDGADERATILHEGVHYLDWAWGGLQVPGPTESICASEDKAWLIEGVYTGEDYSGWWTVYPHCWQYYAPEPARTQIKEFFDMIEEWVYPQ